MCVSFEQVYSSQGQNCSYLRKQLDISIEKLKCHHCRFPLVVSDLPSRLRAIEVNDVFQITLNDKMPYSLLKCHKENKHWHETRGSAVLRDLSLLSQRRTIEDKDKTTTNQTNLGENKKDKVLLCKYFLHRSLSNININQCF